MCTEPTKRPAALLVADRGDKTMPKVHLTDKFCAHAKPQNGDSRTSYVDDHTKGLELLVSNASKAWYWHFGSPKDGKRARLKLGTYPALSLAKARTKALEAKGQVEDGTDPRDIASNPEMTVADLLDAYMAKHVRPRLRSAAHMEKRLAKHVRPVIGNVRLADLHRRDLNRVLDPIIAAGSLRQPGLVFQDMRAALRWAVARGDLEHSPMEGMRKPGVEQPRERVLSDDEIRALWNALPASLSKSKACQRIIKLCLITAQRVGEVAGMRRDELDPTARLWSLPGPRTKNGNPHRVPLSDLAISIIEEALADADAELRKRLKDPKAESAVVFPAGEASLSPMAVARTIGRANETGRFGIAHFTAHDLRRTALDNLARLGIAPIVAGAVANHLSVTKATVTLRVYQHYSYDAEKRQALDLWADRLAAIVDGKGAEVVAIRARA